MPEPREKPWRVAVPQLGSTDWRTEDEAMEHVARRQAEGFWVVLRYWLGGRWETRGQFPPSEPVADALAKEASDGA